ncbi:hypothetical protein [Oleidesulfovibrio sp.]|uniref:hypothetical protein n=1 Tax=Oleidesulfovibrio sp. TaxID=2909707 RepID=UPI003A89E7E3
MKNIWSSGRRGQPEGIANGVSGLQGGHATGERGTVEARIVTETPVRSVEPAPAATVHGGTVHRKNAAGDTGQTGAATQHIAGAASAPAQAERAGNGDDAGMRQHAAEAVNQAPQQVVRTVEEYTITLPEQLPVKDELLQDFKGFCAETGLSPEQAQRAADFYVSRLMQDRIGCRADCEHALRNGVFGNAYDDRLAGARHALTSLDGRMQGRLAPMIEAGWGNHPVFVEMMAHVGEMLGEDALGASLSGGGGVGPMSTEDFLRQEVFRTR